jgi:hypothetical protein
MARFSVPAPGDPVNVAESGQSWSEVVKDMSGISGTGEEHNRVPRSSPIEYFNADAVLHDNELHLMFGRVMPGCGIRLSQEFRSAQVIACVVQ